jgi:putative tricarboxylic transport membrane protein
VAPRPAWPEILVGLGVLAVACVIAADTARGQAPIYAKVGPQVFPYAVAAGIAALGALLVAAGWRGGWRDPAVEQALGPPRREALLWVGLGLLVNAALIQHLGFILASTVLFACIARGFGSRRPGRDLGWGASVALIAYLGFAKLLDIRLGGGLVERWL